MNDQAKVTVDLELLPITAAVLGREDVSASELLQGVCDATIAMYPASGQPLPWVGYLALVDGVVVGTCAFKAPPDIDGVEIAYFTLPPNEGQGIATRMAALLIAIARRHGVSTIRAQTLPEQNASTRILGKLGFRRVGVIEHPEDGPVWEWRLD